MLKMVSLADSRRAHDRLAVFSDIHGNVAAFDSVWAAINAAGLAAGPVLNAGDTVAYGGDSAGSICRVLQRPNIISVLGNYDKHVGEYPDKHEQVRAKWALSRPDKYRAIKEASSQVDDLQRTWLRELPHEVRFRLNDHRIVLCHYVPGSRKEGLHAQTSRARFAEIATTVDADIVIVGHTHSPFVRSEGGVLFVNPGSVGRSWDRSTWAIVEAKPGIAPTGEIMICPS